MATIAGFPSLTVLDHPLIQHKLTLLRDRHTTSRDFKALVSEIAMLMGYEVTRDLATEAVTIETPLERTAGTLVAGKRVILVPILRAGLGMVDGLIQLIPSARVGHIGLDPMLATGGSAVKACSALKEAGARRLRFLALVAAPEGVRCLYEAHPDVPVFVAALDRGLDAHAYILPGLGDAGDRLFGTL
jgi:uracil phosphoribosyltransferase